MGAVQARASDDPSHAISPLGPLHVGAGGGLRTTFDDAGATIVGAGGRGRLATTSFSCDDRETTLRAGARRIDPSRSNRIAIERSGPVREWYVVGPLGLEQGFDVDSRGCERDVRLTLDVADATPVLVGAGVELRGDAGGVLVVDALAAFDARGHALPSRFEVRGDALSFAVDVRGAEAPIVIDPLVHARETIWRAPTPPLLASTTSGAGVDFGAAVAVSGDLAVIGVPRASLLSTAATPTSQSLVGTVLVYRLRGGAWTFEQALSAPDRNTNNSFGVSVATDGTRIVVGAHQHSHPETYRGAAYVFVNVGGDWVAEAELLASDGTSYDYFGFSVGIDGTNIVVGAYSDVPIANHSGSIYVFSLGAGTWTQVAKQYVGPEAGLAFGTSVAIDGTRIVIGARGKAYLCEFTTSWCASGPTELIASAAQGSSYGTSVAIDGDLLAVGAPATTVSTVANAGVTYTFRRESAGNTWAVVDTSGLSETLSTSTEALCGTRVSLSGTRLVVGCSTFDATGPAATDAGRAFVHTWNGTSWSAGSQVPTSAAPAAYDHLGIAVGISGDRLLVGAWRDSNVNGYVETAVFQGNWANTGRLQLNTAQSGTGFGASIAVDGDTAVVTDGNLTSFPGVVKPHVYVYRRTAGTWGLEQAFGTGDAPTYGRLGDAVVVDGNTLAVGDAFNGYLGSVFVFVRSGTTWTLQQKLQSTLSTSADFAGAALALEGDTLVVGARGGKPTGGSNSQGIATVWTRTGTVWTQQAQLAASPGATNERFGTSVALEGERLVVGIPGREVGGKVVGALAVYARSGSTWTLESELTAANVELSAEQLGTRVALAGDLVVSGIPSPLTTGSVAVSGMVRTFVRGNGTWTEGPVLRSPNEPAVDHFGNAIALSGGRLVVGAPRWDQNASNVTVGKAYVYDWIGGAWTPLFSLTGSTTRTQDQFASSVALDGDTLLVGTPWSQDPRFTRYSLGFVDVHSTSGDPQGTACSTDSDCGSRACIDGVCCDTRCGEGVADDCQACSVARGAATDGVCAAVASGQVCRASTSTCDPAETCDGTATSCPADVITPACMPEDGGVGTDGGTRPDGIRSRPSTGLCSAASPGGDDPSFLGVSIALAAFALARRRMKPSLATKRSLVLAALLVLASGAPSFAKAQATADAESVARAQFQLGQAYMSQGRFSEAGAAFEAAYAASNRPQLLYNAFIAYRDGNDPRRAADALRRYLAADPTADNAMMQGRLQALDAQVAELDRQTAEDTPTTEAVDAASEQTPEIAEETAIEAPSSRRSLALPIALIAGGAAIAGAGFTIGALRLRSEESRLDGHCGSSAGLAAGQCLDDAVVADVGSKTTALRALSYGTLAAGVATAAVGAVLLIVGGDGDEAAVAPTASCDRLGCVLGAVGRF